MPEPSAEVLAYRDQLYQMGLIFNTVDGLPRSTHIELESTNEGFGNPIGYDSWQSLHDHIQRLISECRNADLHTLRFYNNYLSDSLDALASPLCLNQMEEHREAMATKDRTLLGILRYIVTKKDQLTPTAYSWRWLRDKWKELAAKQSDDWPWNQGMALENYLKVCNRYVKKRWPEAPDIIVVDKNSARLSFGFGSYFGVYYHLYYHGQSDVEKFEEQEIFVSKPVLTRMQMEGGLREVDGKWYTPDNWIQVMEFDKNGKATRYVDTFFPKEKYNLWTCPHCGRYMWKKVKTPVKELEIDLCPQCAARAIRDNPAHTKKTVFGQYHSHGNWNFMIRRSPKDVGMIPMGIEIEMHPRYSHPDLIGFSVEEIAWELYRQQIALNEKWNEFYCERDGSLADNGIELVSNPMTLSFAQDYWGKMLPVLRQWCSGWNVAKNNGNSEASYGIHITTARRHWKDLALARFIKFLDNKNNVDFNYAMAQRNFAYGSRDSGVSSGCFKKLSDAVNIAGKKIGASKTKYSSVNVKGSRLVEVRIFASTLQQESFLKNYEFIESFWKWSHETAFSISADEYLRWLVVQPNTFRRYPNLLGYLLRDNLYYKTNGRTAIKMKNKYKDIIKERPTGQAALDLGIEAAPNIEKDEECV